MYNFLITQKLLAGKISDKNNNANKSSSSNNQHGAASTSTTGGGGSRFIVWFFAECQDSLHREEGGGIGVDAKREDMTVTGAAEQKKCGGGNISGNKQTI